MMIVDLAIKSVLVSGLGLLAVSLLRKSSASTRHLALAFTLAGICFLPAVISWLPQWHVPFISVREEAVSQPVLSNPVAGPAIPVSSGLDLAAVLVLVWAAVAAFLSLRIVFRLVRLSQLERKLQMAAAPSLQALVSDLCRKSERHVLLLEGPEGESPMVWGHSRPVLLIPSHANEWPEDRLHSVILHELAHVERKDWIVSVFAQFVCALHWFNPVVWILRKRMEEESETAADDRVLSKGVSAPSYAMHLVDVTREMGRVLPSTQAAVAMARPGGLDHRVRAILEERRCRRTARGAVSISLMVSIAAIVGLIGAAKPTLIKQVLTTPAVAPREVTVTVSKTTPPVAIVHHSVAKVAERVKPPVRLARRPSHRVSQTAVKHLVSTRIAAKNPQTTVEVTGSGVRLTSGGKSMALGSGGKVSAESGDDSDDEAAAGLQEAAKEIKDADAETSKEVTKAMKEAEESAKKSGVELHLSRDLAKIPADVAKFTHALLKSLPVPSRKPSAHPPGKPHPPASSKTP